jgi:hypothetical protein
MWKEVGGYLRIEVVVGTRDKRHGELNRSKKKSK